MVLQTFVTDISHMVTLALRCATLALLALTLGTLPGPAARIPGGLGRYPAATPRSIRPEAQGNTSLFDNTQMHMWTPL